jgi:hypothetical protein
MSGEAKGEILLFDRESDGVIRSASNAGSRIPLAQ